MGMAERRVKLKTSDLAKFSLSGRWLTERKEVRRITAKIALGLLEEIEKAMNGLKSIEDIDDFLFYLYYDLGAIMHVLARTRLELQGRKGKRKGYYLLRKIKSRAYYGEPYYTAVFHVLDHAEAVGDEVWAHPYDLSLKEIVALASLCRELDLDCVLRGESEYFPGHTFKIILRRNLN